MTLPAKIIITVEWSEKQKLYRAILEERDEAFAVFDKEPLNAAQRVLDYFRGNSARMR